jgi:hypothetical protein
MHLVWRSTVMTFERFVDVPPCAKPILTWAMLSRTATLTTITRQCSHVYEVEKPVTFYFFASLIFCIDCRVSNAFQRNFMDRAGEVSVGFGLYRSVSNGATFMSPSSCSYQMGESELLKKSLFSGEPDNSPSAIWTSMSVSLMPVSLPPHRLTYKLPLSPQKDKYKNLMYCSFLLLISSSFLIFLYVLLSPTYILWSSLLRYWHTTCAYRLYYFTPNVTKMFYILCSFLHWLKNVGTN